LIKLALDKIPIGVSGFKSLSVEQLLHWDRSRRCQ
jgi:hypothetical protein